MPDLEGRHLKTFVSSFVCSKKGKPLRLFSISLLVSSNFMRIDVLQKASNRAVRYTYTEMAYKFKFIHGILIKKLARSIKWNHFCFCLPCFSASLGRHPSPLVVVFYVGSAPLSRHIATRALFGCLYCHF